MQQRITKIYFEKNQPFSVNPRKKYWGGNFTGLYKKGHGITFCAVHYGAAN
jgi:hypothetical protein